MSGKLIRSQRIKRDIQPMIILPLDHATANGILPGIENPLHLLSELDHSFLNAIIINKGWVLKSNSYPVLSKTPFFIHLSASSSFFGGNKKVITTSIKEAIKLGAEGVSIHINFDSNIDNSILSEVGLIIEQATEFGLPVLSMLYKEKLSTGDLLHMSRIVEELGVDFIKLPYCKDIVTYEEIFSLISTPILLAGGQPEGNYVEFLKNAKEIVNLGASGIIAGRNIFQRVDPNYCLEILFNVIHNKTEISLIDGNDRRMKAL